MSTNVAAQKLAWTDLWRIALEGGVVAAIILYSVGWGYVSGFYESFGVGLRSVGLQPYDYISQTIGLLYRFRFALPLLLACLAVFVWFVNCVLGPWLARPLLRLHRRMAVSYPNPTKQNNAAPASSESISSFGTASAVMSLLCHASILAVLIPVSANWAFTIGVADARRGLRCGDTFALARVVLDGSVIPEPASVTVQPIGQDKQKASSFQTEGLVRILGVYSDRVVFFRPVPDSSRAILVYSVVKDKALAVVYEVRPESTSGEQECKL